MSKYKKNKESKIKNKNWNLCDLVGVDLAIMITQKIEDQYCTCPLSLMLDRRP